MPKLTNREIVLTFLVCIISCSVMWTYGIYEAGLFNTIIVPFLIGIIVGCAIFYLALYKLSTKIISGINDDDDSDPNWWKKGKPSPY